MVVRIGRDDSNSKHTVCSKTTTNSDTSGVTTTTKITIDLTPSPTDEKTYLEPVYPRPMKMESSFLRVNSPFLRVKSPSLRVKSPTANTKSSSLQSNSPFDNNHLLSSQHVSNGKACLNEESTHNGESFFNLNTSCNVTSAFKVKSTINYTKIPSQEVMHRKYSPIYKTDSPSPYMNSSPSTYKNSSPSMCPDGSSTQENDSPIHFRSTSLILNTFKSESQFNRYNLERFVKIPQQLEVLRKLYEDVHSDSEADKEVQNFMCRLEPYGKEAEEDNNSVISGSWSKMRAFKNFNQQFNGNPRPLDSNIHALAEKGIFTYNNKETLTTFSLNISSVSVPELTKLHSPPTKSNDHSCTNFSPKENYRNQSDMKLNKQKYSPVILRKSYPIANKVVLKTATYSENLSSPSLVAFKNEKNSVKSQEIEVPKHIETEITNTIKEIESQILDEEQQLDKKLFNRNLSPSRMQLKSPCKEVLRQPKKSEMAYFGVQVSPQLPKKIFENNINKSLGRFGEKPDLLKFSLNEEELVREKLLDKRVREENIVEGGKKGPDEKNARRKILMNDENFKEERVYGKEENKYIRKERIFIKEGKISLKGEKEVIKGENVIKDEIESHKSEEKSPVREKRSPIRTERSLRGEDRKKEKITTKEGNFKLRREKSLIKDENKKDRSPGRKERSPERKEKSLLREVRSSKEIRTKEIKTSKKEEPRSINETSNIRKANKMLVEPIYQNVDSIQKHKSKSRTKREFDTSILDELTKAADQIMQAVNDYAVEEAQNRLDKENEEKINNKEPLDTISETKSWKHVKNNITNTRFDKTQTKLKPTSSTSSIESITRDCRKFNQSRPASGPTKSSIERQKKKVTGSETSSSIRATTKARRLQRASSREALLQSHGSSSEDLGISSEVPLRKPRLVRRTKVSQLNMTNGLELKKPVGTSTPLKKKEEGYRNKISER